MVLADSSFVDAQVSQPEVPLDGDGGCLRRACFPDVKIGKMLGRHGGAGARAMSALTGPTLFK